MSLMFPPRIHRATAIAAVTMKRPFRVDHECIECEAPGSTDVTMLDEAGDAATIEDFVASGGLNRLEPKCPRCGCGHIVVTNIAYIRQPTDGPTV